MKKYDELYEVAVSNYGLVTAKILASVLLILLVKPKPTV